MNHSLKLLATAISLCSTALAWGDTTIGYCTDHISRSEIFRLGTSKEQGASMRLDSDKLHQLKGSSITALNVAFGSKRTTNGTVNIFITNDLDSETPLASKTVAITDIIKWIDLAFDTPYTITGDEGDLYIGYTAEISEQSSMLLADRTQDVSGRAYFRYNGEWTDSYGLGFGVPSVKVKIDTAPEFTDVVIKPVRMTGYYNADVEYNFQGQIYNFGTKTIRSLDMSVTVGGQTPVSNSLSDLEIAPGSVYDFALPQFSSPAEGSLPIRVEISGVNGGEETLLTDNTYDGSIFFYPTNMERALLLEGFTGQDCSNCPTGHSSINSFIAASTVPVIEVMHHAGYSPDFMTMESDLDYTFFYGGTSTYAPAVMLNRTVVPSVGSVPVMNINTTSQINVASAAVLATEPYVSLSLESTYDTATRQLDIEVKSLTHNDLPAENNVINLFLVQNGIEAYQLPIGQGYIHNCVFRGSLTGNSWGVLLPENSCKAGGEARYTTSLTLPEAIFSDYWNPEKLTSDAYPFYNIATDPANMYLVAYVGAFTQNDVTGHSVYNAVEAPIGGKYVQGGIASVDQITVTPSTGINLRVTGRRITVEGEYDTLSAYTIDGRAVNHNADLLPGIYVARATRGTDTVVKKFIIK